MDNSQSHGLRRFFSSLDLRMRSASFSFATASVLVRGRIMQSDAAVAASFPSQGELGPIRAVVGTVVVVIDARGRTVAVTQTDSAGVYRVKLKPGAYTIAAPGLGISRRVHVRRDVTRSFDFIETAA